MPNSRLALIALGLLGATVMVDARRKAEQRRQTTLEPVASLDLPRYLGAWYEIAKFPNRFEKQCDGFTTAHYEQLPDGTVRVVNRCRRADGRVDEAVGAARQLGAADSPMLQVRFAPAWLSLLPQVWADYWVIDLDPDYQLAAVSEPTREYLWILSRTPTVARPAYEALLGRLARRGFEVGRLKETRQA